MALPEGGRVPWPPKEWQPVYDLYAEHDAWYSGDPDRLAAVYGGVVLRTQRRPWWKFWARRGTTVEHQTRSQLHVPLAQDIAATSAALLFSEPPRFLIPEAHEDGATSGAKTAQDRLNEIVAAGGVVDRLLEAADLGAALGGVFLKPSWDRAVAGYPILAVVHPDSALPEFRWGVLTAVTLWRVVDQDDRSVLRHLERHELGPDGRGVILHGLYRGTTQDLGEPMDLDAHPATGSLEPVVQLPFAGLGVRYVPNMRPNRRFRGLALGQSDYAGAEGLLDALDETWTSWMRDLRLAKARIIVPEEFLDLRDGKLLFDLDREVYATLAMEPGKQSITENQFAIRVQEHLETSLALIERIVDHAGYSPESFGLRKEGNTPSGTALRLRERKSLITQQRKGSFFRPAIEDVLHMMLVIDREILGNREADVFRPRAELADSITPDMQEVAATVELVSRAGAASTETLVRMVHPDWGAEEVKAEVQRILEERGLALPDPMQEGALP